MIKDIISRDDDEYECFPDITRLPSDILVCVYRESEGHVPRDYTRIVVRISEDDGRTWGERMVISETHGSVTDVPGWNCPRISIMGDGRAVICCDSLLWPEGRDLSRRSRIHLWSSEDGIEWKGGRETEVTGIVPGRVGETEDGNWALGTHDVSPGTGKLRQLLWISTGEGDWSPIVVGEDPDLNLCEGSFVKRGREMACIMRENSGSGLPGFKTFSGDSGITWSEVVPTGLLGCHRPVAGWWRDEILVTYRCYPGDGAKNTLFMGALIEPDGLFEPGGRTKERIFPIDCDRNPKPDTGYSGWCELPDGEILVAYYIKDDAPKAQIRSCRFSREDLELNQ